MTDLENIINHYMKNIQVAIPCKIEKLSGMYADVKPQIYDKLEFPVIPSVPILYLGNKTKKLKFKSSVGDIVTVFFTQLDLGRFLASGVSGQASSTESFNLTNAFALPFNFHTMKDSEQMAIVDFEIIGNIKVTGTIEATGDITSGGDVKAGLTSLKTHIHSGVTTGGGRSGPPTV